jgi:uncharacterized membrane protein YfcA
VPTDVALWLMSFMVGTLIGITSMGGAALMTPFLILIVGVRPVLAVGTDLAYSAITKIIGAAMHWRQNTVDIATALRLACGSIPGGTIGVLAMNQLRRDGVDVDQWLRRAIGVVMVTVALVLLFRTLYARGPQVTPHFVDRHKTFCTVAWGAAVGFAVGLTSVGSGSLIVPFLIMLYPLAPARMVGTDVFHAALLVSATALLHMQAKHVEWRLLPVLLAGSVPGVLLGSYLAPRLPVRTMRVGLSLVLLTTGVKLV